MEKLNKYEAFTRAVAAFGDWRTWGRSEHVAYGLIRGVPYSAMEKYCNDSPPYYNIGKALMKLGAWPDVPAGSHGGLHIECVDELAKLVVWIRKPVRAKRVRPVRESAPATAEAE